MTTKHMQGEALSTETIRTAMLARARAWLAFSDAHDVQSRDGTLHDASGDLTGEALRLCDALHAATNALHEMGDRLLAIEEGRCQACGGTASDRRHPCQYVAAAAQDEANFDLAMEAPELARVLRALVDEFSECNDPRFLNRTRDLRAAAMKTLKTAGVLP